MSDENILLSEIINNDAIIQQNVFDQSLNVFDQSLNISQKGPQQPNLIETSPIFINAYSITTQKINKNGVVIFDNTNAIYGDCAHLSNTSDIYIWRKGYYSVYISIFHIEACQFSILKNSEYTAPVSVVGSVNAAVQNTNSFIIKIDESDMITPTPLSNNGYACKLQLINNTNNSLYVTLGSYNSVNQLPHITASITIQSII
jgi:hypothetical protein